MENLGTTTQELGALMAAVRSGESAMRNCAVRFILSNHFNQEINTTAHYREWRKLPMNYARQMELPLTLHFLDAHLADRLLDVSSPKLLALYYALQGYTGVVAGDLEDYFVNDFKAYSKHSDLKIDTAVFDAAQRIPFADGYFDKAFSVSVLEHIPGDGDKKALAEMVRVVKPGGVIAITLPAFSEYVEEWTTQKHYWESVRNEKGEMFFQRRYDRKALEERLQVPGVTVEDVVWIAEVPVQSPRIGDNGTMLHNSYFIEAAPQARRWLQIARRFPRLPFSRYFAERAVSRACHYLTRDANDPNVRQVALKLVKAQ